MIGKNLCIIIHLKEFKDYFKKSPMKSSKDAKKLSVLKICLMVMLKTAWMIFKTPLNVVKIGELSTPKPNN
jgi:hypothetical protein